MTDVKASRYKLINYFDVWGNEEDGWEVNNQCVEFDDIFITEEATDQDLLDYLYKVEFFNTKDADKFYIEDSGDFIEFFEKETMKPLCSLRKVG